MKSVGFEGEGGDADGLHGIDTQEILRAYRDLRREARAASGGSVVGGATTPGVLLALVALMLVAAAALVQEDDAAEASLTFRGGPSVLRQGGMAYGQSGAPDRAMRMARLVTDAHGREKAHGRTGAGS